MGLDVGQKRIGVARASALAMLAEPLDSIAAQDSIKELLKLVDDHSIGTIVVGLPRNLDSKDTKQTEWVRQWVNDAKAKIELPFFWQDEALTSVVAEAERQAHKKPKDIDSLAAAIILQDFLDTPEADRLPC